MESVDACPYPGCGRKGFIAFCQDHQTIWAKSPERARFEHFHDTNRDAAHTVLERMDAEARNGSK